MRLLRLSAILTLLILAGPFAVEAQYTPPVAVCPSVAAGDFDCSESINVADIVGYINYLFKGGSGPCVHLLIADLNCDSVVNITDVVSLINYVFRGDLPPCDICEAHFGDSALALEAEIMASAYGGQVYAPEALKWQIYVDLASIRSQYRTMIPQVDSVTFIAPWWLSRVIMAPDSATYEAIKAGTYTGWDSLNALYQPVNISWSGAFRYVYLDFWQTMNPSVLAEMYAALPGIEIAYRDIWGGDWPTIYRLADGGVRAYIFRQAWGDCPAGCISSKLWYFLVTPSGLQYNGYAEPPGVIPGWWPIAVAAMDAYWQL